MSLFNKCYDFAREMPVIDINNKLKVVQAAILLLFSLGLPTTLLAQTNKPVTEQEVQSLIDKISTQDWGIIIFMGYTAKGGDGDFSEPMREIFKIGTPAQGTLIKNLSNPEIKPKLKMEIILLLGGVGDEAAIKPLIDAMLPDDAYPNLTKSEIWMINECAKIALTNITTADLASVSGTFTGEKCPGKECWEKWWKDNQSIFSVRNVEKNRNQFYVPNYGIYYKYRQ